ncbi:MAG TPA: GIY-YIG nuclease family protein [Gemmatimonadales bacterium]
MGRARCYYVYILASKSHTLYVGSTSHLLYRIDQHRHGLIPGFTARYRVHRLVWWDSTPNARAAVARERELKSWRREKKIQLIETTNPAWRDLALDWFPSTSGQDPSLRSG